MKKLIIKSIFVVSIIVLSMLTSQLYAQPVPPPNGGTNGGHGLTGNQQGAPLDGGLSLLLILGAAYGSKKIKSLRNEHKKDI